MFDLEISTKFNRNNFLCINLKNISRSKIKNLKICFSLIYSIVNITNAKISKNLGRYYEIEQINNQNIDHNCKWSFKVKLERNKYNIYNISSGLEGVFCISRGGKKLKTKIQDLRFDQYVKNDHKLLSQNYLHKIPVIPEPQYYNLNGKTLDSSMGFIISNKKVKKIFNIVGKIIANNEYFYENKNGLRLDFKKIKCKNEEYKIIIKKRIIEIQSNTESGIFYSLVTLMQVLYLERGKIKEGVIHDYPRFSWRGMHLDSARQFYPTETIIKLLNFMAMFKINRFHWHLTDNEAWRLELECFPGLTRKLSYRGYNEFVPPTYGGGFGPTGGYYTKKDIQKIINYAKKLSIHIMPEIDIPSHSWALVNSFEQLKEKGDLSWQDYKGPYPNNTLNPGLKFTWKFIDKIFKEISSIFKFNFVHIGVDERPKNSWKKSPAIIKLMKKNKLQTTKDVQDYFVNKVQKILYKTNKKVAVWNEAVTSSLKRNNIKKSCLVFCWEDIGKGQKIVEQGYDAIICPAQKCYFDMAQSKSNLDRGLVWAGIINTKDVLSWEPLEKISKKYRKNVIGIQGNLWSETITNINFMDSMINPRLIALSEVAWSKIKRRKWVEFKKTLTKISFLTSLMGWKNHRY